MLTLGHFWDELTTDEIKAILTAFDYIDGRNRFYKKKIPLNQASFIPVCEFDSYKVVLSYCACPRCKAVAKLKRLVACKE